ncbi:type I restriction-modification system subunit M [Campylobacter concisus]|uniref:site-specific DNA-methyltransferase (adenine-specific) n=1 Tax=Campylobacter concisus TaxID=199 RepID=A0A7S9WT70_9BACT|nr:type I restriction-modification system subunit M [Campylobacter concisus]QPH92180.1 type I restriction-modification system subunit M [Campylobacter concisus]
MALKKTELYSSLWASCDELRGGMDASLYKNYVLTLLFLKYISDRKDSTVLELPTGTDYASIVALKHKPSIGDELNKKIASIAEANDLQGVINQADFNDEDKLGKGKELVDRLSTLVSIFENLDFSSNSSEGDDLLGDAYEYLMRHFATESGKSKGQFYTPAEVSRIMAQIIGIPPTANRSTTVYDPTCGSGSLLLKAANQSELGLSIYGQEMDVATYALARMNMILHGNDTADIRQGNTIAKPAFADKNTLKRFDFAVANPPFSNKNWTNGIVPTADIYNRFEIGIPPEKNGDYAFLLHLIASLKTTGKGAIILPHGVLFRGDAEARIRTELLRRGIIKGVIGLPTNLFYGTGIPACIIVIDKQVTFNEKGQALSDRGVFMIDASKGFIKDGNKNRLREQDIHKIVDTFTTQKELEHYSRLVSLDEISRNDYNLNIPRYIDSADKADMQDLHAHLYGGGIPKGDIDDLGEFWSIFTQTKTKIFTPNGSLYSPNFAPSELKTTIQASSEYAKFESEILSYFENWHDENDLKSIKQKDHPKELIKKYGESLLKYFKETKLVSDYDVYQVFMDYVADTLSDDVYAIAQNGWLSARDLTPVEKGDKQTPNLILGSGRNAKKFVSEIIPPELVAKRYFTQILDQISLLEAQISKKQDEFTNFVDEFGEDELSNVYDDKDKMTLKSLKEAIRQTSDKNEQEIYNKALQILTEQKELESTLKAATGELNQKVFDKFKTLDESEIKTLVVDDKWLSNLKEQILSTVERAVQEQITRISTLAARYDKTLDELTTRANDLSLRVKAHLDAMDKAR